MQRIIKFILTADAYIRIMVWGFCPECNSDAPGLYDCDICSYDTTSPFNKQKRELYWKKWKLNHKDDLY